MNNKALEKLNSKSEKDQERIDRIKNHITELEAAMVKNPDDSKTAIEAAAAKMQVEAAEKALELTRLEIEAEKERMREAELAQARANIESLKNEAAKIRDQEIRKMLSFFDAYDEWLTLARQHEMLCQKYNIKTPTLSELDHIETGLIVIYEALDGWRANREYRRHIRNFYEKK